MGRRIYFDNAATSFPKPDCVHDAMMVFGRSIGASAGRGAYQEAMDAGEIIHIARGRIAQLINAKKRESIIMTFNCSDGLSMAINGIITDGDMHVITTCMDHNSVLRPLHALTEKLGITVTHVKADAEGMVRPDDIAAAITKKTKLIAVVHGSNVCGSIQDIAAIGKIAKTHQIPFLVDAAQTIGHRNIDVQALGIDVLVFPGHKGLLGPLGTGVMYVRDGFEDEMVPTRVGGTGSKSELPIHPDMMPDKFEAGSHNNIGIAGLGAAVQYLLDIGFDKIMAHDRLLIEAFYEGTEGISGLKVYGPRAFDQQIGVFSVTLGDYEPAELAAILEENFGLLTRSGIHCAPFAHQALGSAESGGTCRFSIGKYTTLDDIKVATSALRQIADSCVHA